MVTNRAPMGCPYHRADVDGTTLGKPVRISTAASHPAQIFAIHSPPCPSFSPNFRKTFSNPARSALRPAKAEPVTAEAAQQTVNVGWLPRAPSFAATATIAVSRKVEDPISATSLPEDPASAHAPTHGQANVQEEEYPHNPYVEASKRKERGSKVMETRERGDSAGVEEYPHNPYLEAAKRKERGYKEMETKERGTSAGVVIKSPPVAPSPKFEDPISPTSVLEDPASAHAPTHAHTNLQKEEYAHNPEHAFFNFRILLSGCSH